MQRLKRFSELGKLFFKMLREDGVGFTLGRAAGFARRRLSCIGFIGRHRQDQVVPPGIPLPQGPEICQAPVVGGKQVVQKSQFQIAAVPQPFFTSVMVRRR